MSPEKISQQTETYTAPPQPLTERLQAITATLEQQAALPQEERGAYGWENNYQLRDLKNELTANPATAELSDVSTLFHAYKLDYDMRNGSPYELSFLSSAPANMASETCTEDQAAELLGKALAAEQPGGPLKTAMQADFARAARKDPEDWNGELRADHFNILRGAYGAASNAELLGIGSDGFSDSIRSSLSASRTIGQMRSYDEVRANLPDGSSWEEQTRFYQRWTATAVQARTGMTPGEAAAYSFSATRDSDTDKTAGLIERLDHFGIDRIRNLTVATGIHGLEAYSIGQLERMEAYALSPQAEAHRLQNHDVNLVLINRAGDGGTTMEDVAKTYDDEHERTLFMEVDSIGDIYRRMFGLHRAGIKPSGLVLAAHGNVGRFAIGDLSSLSQEQHHIDIAHTAGKLIVERLNRSQEKSSDETNYSLQQANGFGRLVDAYMQPSRGIDDSPDDAGRKKIIFNTCLAANEVRAGYERIGVRFDTDLPSLVEHVAREIDASNGKSTIDIYGAAVSMQSQRTENGVQFTKSAETYDEGRTPTRIQRVRLQDGHIQARDSVATIPLHHSR